jgi:hypothetical protein
VAALTGRFDDLDHAQAVGSPLRPAPCCSRAAQTGRVLNRSRGRVGSISRTSFGLRNLTRSSTSTSRRSPGSPGSMARGERLGAADVILAQQENLDREVRVGQQGRESNKFVEHSNRRVTLRRLTDATSRCSSTRTIRRSPATGCTNGKPVLVEQRIKLVPNAATPARVHLDELVICANQVDHEPADRHPPSGHPLAPIPLSPQHATALRESPRCSTQGTGRTRARHSPRRDIERPDRPHPDQSELETLASARRSKHLTSAGRA